MPEAIVNPRRDEHEISEGITNKENLKKSKQERKGELEFGVNP